MSLFSPVNLVCPHCKELVTMEAVGSVNADRRPDFREAILDDKFQDITCDSCSETYRLQPDFNYLDAGKGLWIASLPANRLADYIAIEDEVTELFEKSYGKQAPKAAQAVGEALDVRITFGWPAIREKLLAREHDLDDVVLEMLKLDLIRQLPTAPIGPGTELRLIAVLDDQFAFAWVDTGTEAPSGEIVVARDMYDAIRENQTGWAATRAKLEDRPFVDIQKLYMGEGRAA